MMLRSKNQNNIIAGTEALKPTGGGLITDQLAKRGKKQTHDGETDDANEPKPKRAALVDLSQAIQNVVIDSTKKAVEEKPNRTGKRSNSSSDTLGVIDENNENENLEPIPSEKVRVVPKIEPKHQAEYDPCPEFDYDKENNDPNNVPEYAMDIFKYYRARESIFKVGNYMERQAHLTPDTRMVLVDWMVEIQENFELNHETLYLGVKLLDIFLDRTEGIVQSDLQMIASTCLFIASKYDERSPPLIEDFIYIAEDSFTRERMIHMEMKVLRTVGYDLGSPLSYRYVRRYARVMKTDMSTLTLARYILETTLLHYELVSTSESRLAAAAFLLASKMRNPKAAWTPVLTKYSGYVLEDIEPVMWELNHMLHIRFANRDRPGMKTIISKYSHTIFYEAAHVPLLQDMVDTNRDVIAPPPL